MPAADLIRLLCVGEGERDRAVVPALVETLLGREVDAEFRPWARLNLGGRGFGRNLRYAIRQVKSLALDGLVAVVDGDRDPQRRKLKILVEARAEDRQGAPPVASAVGEAIPHLEAWLLDDSEAVRTVLSLPPSSAIQAVAKVKNPKPSLEALLAGSARQSERPRHVWREIASAVAPGRCQHGDVAGFAAFAKDVESEFRTVGESGRKIGAG